MENKTVRVYGLKPDGTKVFNNLTIINAARGLAELQLTTQMLVKPGCLKLELVIYEATDILSTTKFDINIISCLRDDEAIESTNEFSALTLGLSKLDEWDKYFKETTGAIEEKYTERLNGIDSSLEEKVNKEQGKGLSTNDYTNEEQTEVSKIKNKATKEELAVERARIDSLSKLQEGSTTGDAELVDARVGANGKVYTNVGSSIREQIKEVKNNTFTIVSGKNMYNTENNTLGKLVTTAIGKKQVIDSNDVSLVWQKININNTEDYSMYGIRMYSITDNNDLVLVQNTFHNVASSINLLKENIPETAYYLYVATYLENADTDTQIEKGKVSTSYEKYTEFDHVKFNDTDINLAELNDDVVEPKKTWSSEKIVSEISNNNNSYELNNAKNEIQYLENKIELMKNNMSGMYNIKNGNTSSKQEVVLNDTNRKKMILHLHKRKNNGYDTTNDVYLENCNNDFSDIRVKDDKGNVLPFRFVSKCNVDIVPDKRLGKNHKGIVFKNSKGELVTGINGYVSYSTDNGITWNRYTNLDKANIIVVNVTEQDVIFFSYYGELFRSEYPYDNYEKVLDISEDIYTGNFILSTSMVTLPNGDMFIGTYQMERAVRIYKSTDDGITWDKIYTNTKYQHVHNMFVDLNVNPIAIYAGLDGGGGILKSTDGGTTWNDLRESNTNIPQSTDYGVIYSDAEKKYRLFGGETAIVGGNSILKSENDVDFKPVLEIGNGVYMCKKINDVLVASTVSTYSFKNTSLLISKDDGETWEQVYTSQPLLSGGASDGYRFMSKINENEIIVGCQSNVISPLRIFSDGYFAEIIVDIPEGCNKIEVESGFACENLEYITNTFNYGLNCIVDFNFNENCEFVKNNVSQEVYGGQFKYLNIGKHLSYFYPYIISDLDKNSIKLSSLKTGLVVDNINLNVTDGITISFWGRFGYDTIFDILSSTEGKDNNFIQMKKHALYSSAQLVVARYPIVPKAFSKYDIIVDYVDNTITTYENARKIATSTVDIVNLLTNIKELTTIKILNVLNCDEDDCIQHFKIIKGKMNENDIYNSYNDMVSDNHIYN